MINTVFLLPGSGTGHKERKEEELEKPQHIMRGGL